MKRICKKLIGAVFTASLLYAQPGHAAPAKESLLTATTVVSGVPYRASLRYFDGGKDFIRQVGVQVPATCGDGTTETITFQPHEIAMYNELRKDYTSYTDTLVDISSDPIPRISFRRIGFTYKNSVLTVRAARSTEQSPCEGSIVFKFNKQTHLADKVYRGYGEDNFDSWGADITTTKQGKPILFDISGGLSLPDPAKPGFYTGRVVSCSQGYSRIIEEASAKKGFRMYINADSTDNDYGERRTCLVEGKYVESTDSYKLKITFEYTDSDFSATKTVNMRAKRRQ